MKVLSIIIPSYNSEKFLDKCIPSFFSAEVLDKLDIIIVNDGSSDATVQVAEKYCAMYPASIRLISQENKGHGGALNTGCTAAQGKYLKIVDADDWVETRNLPAFIDSLTKIDSDVVVTHFHTIDVSTGEIENWCTYPSEFGEALSLEDIMADWRSFYRCLTFHGITYNTEFYRTHGIQLSEHVFYEDYEYATFPCCHARTVTPLNLFIYDYRIGDVNQSVSSTSKLKRIGHHEKVLNRMILEGRCASGLSSGGKAYLVTKTQELLLSYFTTVLLIDPNRKNGRAAAHKMISLFRKEMPDVAALAYKKYLVFCLMNRLHVSKTAWDKFLKTGFYNRLRGNHNYS